jgi:hypothetical protein
VADLYLDDCQDSDLLVALLAAAGHSVRSPRQVGTHGASDAEHLEFATGAGCALITRNVEDFRGLHAEWQTQHRAHCGILLVYRENIKGKDMAAGDIVCAIGNLLTSGLPIVNELHVLNHWR